MQFEVLKESRNDLLHRKELRIAVELPQTPARKDLVPALAAKLGVPETHIVLNKISQRFGSKVFEGFVKIYDSPEALKKYEAAFYMQRGKPKAAKEEKKEEKK